MKERPILFSGVMVRALLDGSKTQTRRIVKVRNEQPPAWATFVSEGHSLSQNGAARPVGSFYWSEEQAANGPLKTLRRWPILPAKHPMAGDWYWTPSPFGKIGDHLWVRETWRGVVEINPPGKTTELGVARYVPGQEYCRRVEYQATHERDGEPWRPSIHMPRWASRITLEVTGVRVERLQDISYEDAIAEGVSDFASTFPDDEKSAIGETPEQTARRLQWPQRQYHLLWDSLNAARGVGWDANPWVWVVEFKRVTP